MEWMEYLEYAFLLGGLLLIGISYLMKPYGVEKKGARIEYRPDRVQQLIILIGGVLVLGYFAWPRLGVLRGEEFDFGDTGTLVLALGVFVYAMVRSFTKRPVTFDNGIHALFRNERMLMPYAEVKHFELRKTAQLLGGWMTLFVKTRDDKEISLLAVEIHDDWFRKQVRKTLQDSNLELVDHTEKGAGTKATGLDPSKANRKKREK